MLLDTPHCKYVEKTVSIIDRTNGQQVSLPLPCNIEINDETWYNLHAVQTLTLERQSHKKKRNNLNRDINLPPYLRTALPPFQAEEPQHMSAFPLRQQQSIAYPPQMRLRLPYCHQRRP